MTATFDYAAFIEELRSLVSRAKNFSVHDRNINSDAFRRWRHELDDLITRINRKRYDIACKIDGRSFQVMSYSTISAREQKAQFDRDLDDTIAELDLVIARYEKYGDPRAKIAPAVTPAQNALPPPTATCDGPTSPEKVTISWLIAHVPVSMIAALVASYVVVFSFGFAAASTKIGKALVEWVTPATATTPPIEPKH